MENFVIDTIKNRKLNTAQPLNLKLGYLALLAILNADHFFFNILFSHLVTILNSQHLEVFFIFHKASIYTSL